MLPVKKRAGDVCGVMPPMVIVKRSSMKEAHMFMHVVIVAFVIGLPLSGFAQMVDKGEYVQVSKGVRLCSVAGPDVSTWMLDPEDRFWRVTSKARANGTQTVDAFVFESSYDRESGETTIEERRYDDKYAVLFKRASEHKGMLLILSPKDGQVEATVEICRNKK